MTMFVCLTSVRTGKPVAVNPAHVTSVFPAKVWHDMNLDEHKEHHVKLKIVSDYDICVRESYEEILKAFEEAGVQIRKAKSNG